MTMIMSFGNRDNVIQVSDRRLTNNGLVIEEDWGKSGTIIFPTGRFIFGFSGIAKAQTIDIRRWLLESLYELGSPDYEIPKTFERLRNRLTIFFKTDRTLRLIKPSAKRLSIMFSGYLCFYDPPIIGNSIISNYEDPKKGLINEEPWSEFVSFYRKEKLPVTEYSTFIKKIGAVSASIPEDEDALTRMLRERKPHKAIISKAISIMLKMADRSKAKGLIGKQLTWIRIPSSIKEAMESGYESNIRSHVVYFPSQITLLGDNNRSVIEEPKIEAVNPESTPPMNYPRSNKNAPCPCGSGRRYRHCHGKKKL
jgi:hypothetical protein